MRTKINNVPVFAAHVHITLFIDRVKSNSFYEPRKFSNLDRQNTWPGYNAINFLTEPPSAARK